MRFRFFRPTIPPRRNGSARGRRRLLLRHAEFPNCWHICELEPETRAVELDRYTVVDDCGTVINPLLAKGQIMDGIPQGAGQALYEGHRL